ncbi:uncharacterized protein [Musca autumnalis]|uniref:uncharacterized protein n=1 Tax=Musca autumnalis TaxID=221902 RepID=UPI003CF17D49
MSDTLTFSNLEIVWKFVIDSEISAYFTIAFLVLLLPTIFVYSTIKELKENIRLQLFIMYLSTIFQNKIMALLTFYKLYAKYYDKDRVDSTSHSTGIALILSLNAISFELWHMHTRPINVEKNVKKDRRRLFGYAFSIYGLGAVLGIAQQLTKGTSFYWFFRVGIMVIILLINFTVFLLLSIYICRTRLSVAQLVHDSDLKRELVIIILRLFAMMGISRLIVFGIIYIGHVSGVAMMQVVEVSEALMIFVLFVMKENIVDLMKTRFCCCCKSKEDVVAI